MENFQVEWIKKVVKEMMGVERNSDPNDFERGFEQGATHAYQVVLRLIEQMTIESEKSQGWKGTR